MARQHAAPQVLDHPTPAAYAQPNRLQLLERRLERVERLLERSGDVWLRPIDAQKLIPCTSLKSTYEWFRSHGIVRASDGTVLRSDLLKAKQRQRTRRVMAPASLANLRKARA